MKPTETFLRETTKEETSTSRVLYEQEYSTSNNMVREALPAYNVPQKRQGEYTVEDYKNWPEDERVELIDGEIIKMDSPSTIHQTVSMFMSAQFYNYVQKKKGKCLVWAGPIDVQLDEDDKTMVVPDMIVLCDRGRRRFGEIWGAPDFVLEILSPSNRSHDLVRKKKKYIAAGVREYWIIDVEKDRLLTYTKGNDYLVSIYPLEGEVGVEIYNGDLKIDLGALKDYLNAL